MHPILIELGTLRIGGAEIPLAFGSYGVFYALALATGGIVTWRLGRTFAPDFPWIDMVFTTSIAGFLGAKVANAVVFLPDIVAGRKPWIAAFAGGGVFLGAILGGGLVATWFIRRNPVPMGRFMNAAFVAVPTGHVLGRTGCFLAGCCYGKPTDVPWAVTFDDPAAARFNGTPLGVPVHPSQLYEAGFEAFNAAVAWTLWRRGAPPWSIAFAWIGLYGTERFFLELLRGDVRGSYGPLSTSQWGSLAMLAISATGFTWIALRRRPARGAARATRRGRGPRARRAR